MEHQKIHGKLSEYVVLNIQPVSTAIYVIYIQNNLAHKDLMSS